MSARKSPEQFISDARQLHGERFDYLTNYVNAITKIEIKCRACSHRFKQTPNSHLGGAGCPTCARNNIHLSRISERDRCAHIFVARAQEVHGVRYLYTSTKYGKNCDSKVDVICRKHGLFSISPSNHLKGKGCPLCSKTGFDQSKTAYLYLLAGETVAHGEVVKIGITNTPKQRLAGNKRHDRIAWKMIGLARYPDGFLPQAFEKILKDFFGKPFKGKERFVCSHREALNAFNLVTTI